MRDLINEKIQNIFMNSVNFMIYFGLFVFIYFPLHISDLNYVEEIKGFTVSQYGGAVLVDQRNFTYIKNNTKANRIFWLCPNYRHPQKDHSKCKARATTCGKYIMKLSGTHNHEPKIIDKMLKKDE